MGARFHVGVGANFVVGRGGVFAVLRDDAQVQVFVRKKLCTIMYDIMFSMH